jgi:hypothetical protein
MLADVVCDQPDDEPDQRHGAQTRSCLIATRAAMTASLPSRLRSSPSQGGAATGRRNGHLGAGS